MKFSKIIIYLLIMTTWGCNGFSSPTVIPLPSPTATVAPTMTLTPLPPTATSTPIAKSTWRCDPSGGLGCFADLKVVKMLNENEGWILGEEVLLHYITPTWELVPIPNISLHNPNDMSIVAPDEWWAVAGTQIIHYDHGQLTIIEGFGRQLLSIDMVSPTEGWIVGDGGLLSHYEHGMWKLMQAETEHPLSGVSMINAEEGWAVGPFENIFHYTNQQWVKVKAPYGDFQDVAMINDQQGWIVGNNKVDNSVLHYQDGVWQEVMVNSQQDYTGLYKVSMVNDQEGWAVGLRGQMFHCHQGQWTEMNSPNTYPLGYIDMVSEQEGWAVGNNSTILHYHDGKWEVVSEIKHLANEPDKPISISDMAWLDNGEGWGVGNGIYHYTQGSWQILNIPSMPPKVSLNAISVSNTDEGWAVGVNGVIVHYHDNLWQVVSTPVNKDLLDIQMLNAKEGWAVGFDGTILHYSDNQWQQLPSPLTYPYHLQSISMSGPDEGWIVGVNGTLLHYRDGTWQLEQSATQKALAQGHVALYQVEMFGATDGWALGEQKTLLRYQNGNWQIVSYPAYALAEYSVSFMDMLNPDEGWFMTVQGVFHYQQGQWEKIESPIKPTGRKILMFNDHEGWIFSRPILHYTNQP